MGGYVRLSYGLVGVLTIPFQLSKLGCLQIKQTFKIFRIDQAVEILGSENLFLKLFRRIPIGEHKLQ